MSQPENLDEHADFSLVRAGLLFQLYRRVFLSGDALEMVRRRIVVIAAFAWVPLFLLSLLGGHALGATIKIPFLYDIEAHVRFLIALPILVGAELTVDSRIRNAVKRFVERRIILPDEMPGFNAAITSATRTLNSVIVEVALLIFVYTAGLWIWWNEIATGTASWYAMPEGSQLHLTLAGYWYVFVSIPVFQFILVRWYFRFFIWFKFLWHVSRLNLRLLATHPDRAAGLGFLGTSSYAFGPILFAQGTQLAGVIASKVLYDGQDLMTFKMEAAGLVVFFMFFILSPLLVFTPGLARAKQKGLADYGRLASRYVEGFQGKWIEGGVSTEEQLLGSGDIQSLADLQNSFAVVREMGLVPFGLKDVFRLAAATAAPLLPLALTVVSLEELLKWLIKTLL